MIPYLILTDYFFIELYIFMMVGLPKVLNYGLDQRPNIQVLAFLKNIID